jgi:hypothetical protein
MKKPRGRCWTSSSSGSGETGTCERWRATYTVLSCAGTARVVPTQAGYRANWRDAAGRQRARTFPTKREATAYLAEFETAVSRGLYVDPHAGRMRFGAYAARCLTARNDEITTAARDASIMRNHVIARWGTTPLAKDDPAVGHRAGRATLAGQRRRVLSPHLARVEKRSP